jgi:hypothetical protein
MGDADGAAFFATGLHAGAWFNLDLIWSAALVATGTLTLIVWGTERMRQSFGAERKLDRIEIA